MQIVIDIDEYLYKTIKTLGIVVEDGDAVAVSEAIQNGTPLPKGHGRIIDESKITYCEQNNYFMELITNAPTIIKADTAEKGGITWTN